MYLILKKNRICLYTAACLVFFLFFYPAQAVTAQPEAKEAKSSIEKTLTNAVHGVYARLPADVQKMLKSSVVLSIAVNGYKATKETYYRNVRGQQAHPSMVTARAVIGFAGCFAAALFLGKIFFLVFSAIPFAGRFLGPLFGLVGVASGCIAGAIGAEWLFEMIMPLQGAGSKVSNALLGGALGGIIGAVTGLLMEMTFASNKKGGLAGFFRSMVPTLMDAFAGLFYGGLLGALAGAIAFFYIFL